MTVTEAAKAPINWPTVSFIAGTSLAALAWPLYAWHYGVTWLQIAMAVTYYAIAGLSITVGYHRLIAHRTFKAHPAVKAVLLVTGAAAWQGSALEWGTEHVMHHARIDTDGDPYNRTRGFWYSHIGWLLRKQVLDRRLVPPFLKNDRLVVAQDRWYVPIAVTTSFLLPLALGGVGGLLIVGGVAVVALHHSTWLINSLAHTGNNKPYNPDVTAADNWLLAVLTFGEGYHNYHHAFPSDYRNGIGKLSWDPSKWTIWTLAKLGVASDLKRISPVVIWRRRVDIALSYQGSGTTSERLVERTRHALEALAARTETRLTQAAAKLHELGPTPPDLAELRRRLGAAREDWKHARDGRRARRMLKLQEMADQLSAYRAMLERLSGREGAAA